MAPCPTCRPSRFLAAIWLPALLAGLAASSCAPSRLVERRLMRPDELPADLGPDCVKAHLRDGGLLVFDHWTLDDSLRTMSGRAFRYDADRRLTGQGPLSVPLDSLVLLESNRPVPTGHVPALVTQNIFLATGGALCALHPKACFGSCPTFYTLDGPEPILQAEGFSSSVAPCLEATDVDALCRDFQLAPDFTLEMRDEALETHQVRQADLLLVPLRPGESAGQAVDGSFHALRGTRGPSAVVDVDARDAARLSAADGEEWRDEADPEDLGARRVLEFHFDAPQPGSRPMLVVQGRQSLLTTYVFYQALAWMGDRAGDWLAALERGEISWKGSFGELGSIGVEVWTLDGWTAAGTLAEVGPLAVDRHLLALPEGAPGPLKVRLDLTRGNWRIDQVALAASRPAEALRIQPCAVERVSVEGVAVAGGPRPDPQALEALLDPERLLATQPGDAYRLHYPVPDSLLGAGAFLETRGWYLEWMRPEWRGAGDPRRLATLFARPERGLRQLAPAYKRVEAQMDSLFWSSRYVR